MEVCDDSVGAFKLGAEVSNDALLFQVVSVGGGLCCTFIVEVALVDLLEMGCSTGKIVIGCFQLLDPSLQAVGGSGLCLLIKVLIGVKESLQAFDAS